jgi:predicted Zn finger-like uncharacterized protein
MIVQCEVCETKYNLEDSKITPEGVKVRCAKCQHIFAVTPTSVTPPTPPSPPTPPTPESAGDDFLQDFESFEKFHKDLIDTPGATTRPPMDEERLVEKEIVDKMPQDTGEVPPPEDLSMEEFPTEEWPGPSLDQQGQTESIEEEMDTPTFDMRGLEDQDYFERPTVAPKKRKTSWTFVLIGILIIIALGGFYLWSERGMRLSLPGNIPSILKSIPERLKSVPGKLQSVWNNIRGIERGSLSFSDLEGYKDTIGEVPVFVITGKILNDTNKTKRHVRVKAILLNDKNKVLDEKQTLCGSYFTNEDLKKLPPRFIRGDFKLRPPVPSQMRVAPRMTVPFVVIFPNMSPDAQEFEVEIIEAPNA